MGLKSLLLGTILSGFLLIAYLFPFSAYAQADITSNWNAENNLPQYLASHTSFVFNDEIFIVGGANNLDYSEILKTNISGGGLGDWSFQSSSLPQRRYWAAGVAKNNHVYQLGGASLQVSGIYTDSVLIGSLEGGELGSWIEQAPLPKKLGLGAVVISGDRIYFSGGFNSSTISNKLYSAPLNSDGSVGAWIDTSTMPDNLYGHGMIEHEGHLYVIGGRNSILPTEYVYHSSINPDGSVSSWEIENLLPQALYRPAVAKVGNTILAVGGESSGGTQKTIYYTTINPDGSLEPWELSSNLLPIAAQGGSLALVNNYLYYTGGYNSQDGYLNSVYFTQLDNQSSEISLDVPLFMQTDPAWGNHIYDSASLWSSDSPTISRWGCALTSAAMVFNYHKITKLPNGQDLSPANLNAWLKAQPDGYVGSGWVNWNALGKLSKQAKSKNPQFAYDALEVRQSGYNPTQLKSDLENNMPGILEVPEHFIVAKGTIGASFAINDPFYADRTTLSSYSESFIKLTRFIPSNTDLSHMMFIVEDGIEVTVKDEKGNVMGEGFTQQPLTEAGGTRKSGSPMYMYYVPQPLNGEYTIEVFGDKQYRLQSFFYDINGEVKMMTTSGVVNNDEKDIYTVSFNKENTTSVSVIEQASFDNLLSDIDYFYSVNKIKSKVQYLLLRKEVLHAKNFLDKKGKAAKVSMGVFIVHLDLTKRNLITEDAYKILRPQALILFNSL